MSAVKPCRPFLWRWLLPICAVVVLGVAVPSLDPSVDFRRYFASASPGLIAALACLSGIAALKLLQERYGFCVVSTDFRPRNLMVAAGAAMPFMVAVTLLDLSLRFPPGLNVRLPTALAFYPAMGLIAQFLLHILPFALVLAVLGFGVGNRLSAVRIWLAILLAALPEALVQMSATLAQDGGARLLGALVALHLCAFGIVELHLYRRFDFLSMYVFRLTYYGYWHVLYAALRA